MIAYESLKEKREAELEEELYMRPFEDIAVEEFLEQLPKPQIEEIVEPEPMDLPARRRKTPTLRWIPLASTRKPWHRKARHRVRNPCRLTFHPREMTVFMTKASGEG